MLVVVHTAAGQVLMLERQEPAGYWQSVTGSLQWGETPLQAAHRELQEETGLDVEVTDCHRSNRFPIHPAWRARYSPHDLENTEHVFRAEVPGAVSIVINPKEHRRYRWLEREAAAACAFSSFNRDEILALPVGAP